jgi:NADH-quinone oxidoreductase subunit D
LGRNTRRPTVCFASCWSSTARSSSAPTRTSGSCTGPPRKLAENRTFLQALPYMDRLDYVSMMCNEHAYCLAIERLLGIEVPLRAQYIRVMFDEITRILNHLLWIGSHSLDVGGMTTFLYAFPRARGPARRLRGVSGRADARGLLPPRRRLPRSARSHAPVLRRRRRATRGRCRNEPEPAGHAARFHRGFHAALPGYVDDYETLLTENRIWKQRTVGIGVVSAERAMALGFTGPMLRGSGVPWDLRKKQPYAVYDRMDFDIPVGTNGDCYDRYLVRVEEMRQANRIIRQCVAWLRENPGPVIIADHKVASPPREGMKTSMEDLIHHFKLFTEGMHVPAGEAYAAIEHPKGEFGIYLKSDGANKPYRMKIRAPGFAHLSALDEMARGHMIADAGWRSSGRSTSSSGK